MTKDTYSSYWFLHLLLTHIIYRETIYQENKTNITTRKQSSPHNVILRELLRKHEQAHVDYLTMGFTMFDTLTLNRKMKKVKNKILNKVENNIHKLKKTSEVNLGKTSREM